MMLTEKSIRFKYSLFFKSFFSGRVITVIGLQFTSPVILPLICLVSAEGPVLYVKDTSSGLGK